MNTNRQLQTDDLPEYNFIRKALSESVTQALDQDFDLVALGGHEQAIAHRIAVYLEAHFCDYHVDCEYNRNKHKAKHRRPETLGASQNMRPDIIVHRRNSENNVLAIELKANANPADSNDLDKLKCLKAEDPYLYQGVAFVCIRNAIDEMRGGVISATVEWYDVTDSKLILRRDESTTLQCDSHIDQVKRIIEQRDSCERTTEMSA